MSANQFSPFQKKSTELKKEQSSVESFWGYAVSRLDKMFLDYLPSDDIKAMSPEYLYPIGGFAFLCLLGIFLSVFINGYYTTVNREFLSPSTGTTASKNCVTIPTINTGTYLATQDGHWQGQDGFQFGLATYELSVVSTAFTYDEYTMLMNKVYDSLQFVKSISVNYDLASNLVYWMSAVFVPYHGNTAQRLTFMGTPLVVLDRQKVTGTVSSVAGDCNVTSVASFNGDDGLLTLTYDYLEYVNDPVCNQSISPMYLSYLPETDNGQFSIHLDTRSIITAVAVNMGIVEVSDLVSIDSLSSVYPFQGVNYTVTVAYDPKYNGMEPISCINVNVTANRPYTFCIVKVQNEVYAIPLFNHYGQSAELPTPCNCSTIDPADLQNSYFSCNLFSFLSGVLFFPSNSPDEIMRMWLDVGLTTINQILTSPVNNYAFNAQFIDSYWGRTSPYRDLFLEPSYREQAYEFCNVTGNSGPCSLITFSIFDKTPQNWAVTDYYYQLMNGACANTFVPGYEEWEELIDTPFAPLTQDYQKCHEQKSTVILSQAGSTVGNVSILAPFCIAAILVCVYYAQVCGLASIKKTYTNAEKEEALQDLALKLLLVRDGDKAVIDQDGVLAHLVEELGSEALNKPDAQYRDGRGGGEPGAKIDWAALQMKVGLRKRQSSTSVGGTPRTQPSPSVASVSDGAVFPPEPGSEMYTAAALSPIHFTDAASTPSALAVQAAKHKYVILNDYEVTPALLQLLASKQHSPTSSKRKFMPHRRDSSGSNQGSMKDSTAEPSPGETNGVDRSADEKGVDRLQQLESQEQCARDGLESDALLKLLDDLIASFQAAAEQDRSQSVWSVVSQTAILRTVNVAAFPSARQMLFYYKLCTLLALHAAVMLNVPLKEVKQQRASGVAYIVGMDVLTLADIRKLL